MSASNLNSFSSTYFLLQEERKRLHYDNIRKIIIISGVVVLCLISAIIIRNIHSEISGADQKLAASSIATSSTLTPDDDSKELPEDSLSDSIISRRKNETIVSNGDKSDTTTIYSDEFTIGPTDTIMPNDDSDKTRKDYSDLCKSTSFDTILSFKNDTFVLKDDWYWKLSNNSIAPEYPKLLSQKWPGLPGKIDAAFTDHKDAYTYFFKGSQYWKFNGEKLEVGFPRLIVKDFLGVPNNLQAASMGNRFIGEVYFFKGDIYWVVNMNNPSYRTTTVIHPITYWPGIPSDLDAVLRSTDYIIYFFKGDRYYKYHEEQRQSRVIKEGHIASDWFGCDTIKAT